MGRRWLAWLRQWPNLVAIAACCLIVGLYITNDDMGGDPRTPRGDGVYRPVLARGDGHMQYLMARSTALDFDWVFDNDLARFGDPWNEPRTKTGRKSIIQPIGAPLVWTPMIWTAQAGAFVANLFGADIAMHGYTLWHQRFVFLSSALFACGAVLLGRRLAKQTLGGRWASTYAAVAILLGTSLTFYATYMPSYSHAIDAFACAAFLAYWALTLGRRDLRRWIALGVLLGIAMLIRVQELAMGIVVAIEVGVRCYETLRAKDRRAALRWLGGGALVLVVALVVFIPQLLEWRLVFGDTAALPQGKRYTRFEAPMVMELLFSRRNGWFSTTPLAYLGALGLFVVPRRARLVGIGMLATVAIQVYLNSTVLDWWGSSAFGQRRMCNVTLPLVFGLASLFVQCARLAARWGRFPLTMWHVPLVLFVAPCVATNYNHLDKLGSGKAAESELDARCCTNVPKPLRKTARIISERIGNPFEFPANVLFAIRHGVSIQTWGETGDYPLVADMADMRDDHRLWQRRGVWRVASPNRAPFLVGGWSAPGQFQRTLRYTTSPRATALIPNLMPYGQRVTVWLAPAGATHVALEWNGDRVAEVDLKPGWNPVHFDLPDIEVHTNELSIVATPAPFSATDWPASAAPVGVAVSDVEFQFLAGLAAH